MKKTEKPRQRLHLSRQTLRRLETPTLALAVGGNSGNSCLAVTCKCGGDSALTCVDCT
jgi:hypothetical protein